MNQIQTHQYSFFVTTPTVGYSDKSEWILDTRVTYHVCPKRDWFSSFKNLDGCFTVMGDDHPWNVKGVGTVRIKMIDGIVQELKGVRHVPQLKRNLISVGALKMLSLVVSIWDSVLKMTKSSMVVTKGVRRNNLYYLKRIKVTGQVETSISSDDICTQVWQMRLGYGEEKSLQPPAKKGSLEGASTCNLKLSVHNVLDKNKVKFNTTTHRSKGLLDCSRKYLGTC